MSSLSGSGDGRGYPPHTSQRPYVEIRKKGVAGVGASGGGGADGTTTHQHPTTSTSTSTSTPSSALYEPTLTTHPSSVNDGRGRGRGRGSDSGSDSRSRSGSRSFSGSGSDNESGWDDGARGVGVGVGVRGDVERGMTHSPALGRSFRDHTSRDGGRDRVRDHEHDRERERDRERDRDRDRQWEREQRYRNRDKVAASRHNKHAPYEQSHNTQRNPIWNWTLYGNNQQQQQHGHRSDDTDTDESHRSRQHGSSSSGSSRGVGVKRCFDFGVCCLRSGSGSGSGSGSRSGSRVGIVRLRFLFPFFIGMALGILIMCAVIVIDPSLGGYGYGGPASCTCPPTPPLAHADTDTHNKGAGVGMEMMGSLAHQGSVSSLSVPLPGGGCKCPLCPPPVCSVASGGSSCKKGMPRWSRWMRDTFLGHMVNFTHEWLQKPEQLVHQLNYLINPVGNFDNVQKLSFLDPFIDGVTDPGLSSAKWLTVADGYFGMEGAYVHHRARELRSSYQSSNPSAERVPNIHVTGTALSNMTLKYALKLGFVDAISEENVEDLSFPDERFDYVLIKEAFHHLTRPYLGLYELIRVCRHGVILIEPTEIAGRPASYWASNPPYARSLVIPDVQIGFESDLIQFRLSVHELQKVAMALNLPAVAVKGLNNPTGSRSNRTRYFMDLNSLNSLGLSGQRPFNLVAAVVFKQPPSETLKQRLIKDHFLFLDVRYTPFPYDDWELYPNL